MGGKMAKKMLSFFGVAGVAHGLSGRGRSLAGHRTCAGGGGTWRAGRRHLAGGAGRTCLRPRGAALRGLGLRGGCWQHGPPAAHLAWLPARGALPALLRALPRRRGERRLRPRGGGPGPRHLQRRGRSAQPDSRRPRPPQRRAERPAGECRGGWPSSAVTQQSRPPPAGGPRASCRLPGPGSWGRDGGAGLRVWEGGEMEGTGCGGAGAGESWRGRSSASLGPPGRRFYGSLLTPRRWRPRNAVIGVSGGLSAAVPGGALQQRCLSRVARFPVRSGWEGNSVCRGSLSTRGAPVVVLC